MCLPCSQNCINCLGPSETECLACKSNSIFQTISPSELANSVEYKDTLYGKYLGKCTNKVVKRNLEDVAPKIMNFFVGVKIPFIPVVEDRNTFKGTGTLTDPYEDLIKVFEDVYEGKYDKEFQKIYINIYLFKQDHFILDKDYYNRNPTSLSKFSQREVYISINPLPCGVLPTDSNTVISDTTICMDYRAINNKIVLYNKSTQKGIFIIYSGLALNNIILDNIDNTSSYEQRLTRTVYCENDDKGYLTSKNNCKENNEGYAGTYIAEPFKYIFKFSKGNLQLINKIKPFLSIDKCEFRNFYNHGYYTMIYLKSPGIVVEVTNSKFYNFVTNMSILKNSFNYINVNSKTYETDYDNEFLSIPGSDCNSNWDLKKNSCSFIRFYQNTFNNIKAIKIKNWIPYFFYRGMIFNLQRFPG